MTGIPLVVDMQLDLVTAVGFCDLRLYDDDESALMAERFHRTWSVSCEDVAYEGRFFDLDPIERFFPRPDH